jgi:acyl carrier protein
MRTMSEHTQDSLTARVFEILRDEILSVDSGFTPQTNLVEAGLDSLAVTQLMLSIEESTGVWIDESLLTPENLENAEALAALVHAELENA